MSYYIGFRFGWVRAFGHIVGWYDTAFYHHWPRGVNIGTWRFWAQ